MVQKSRRLYLEARQEFLDSKAEVVANPVCVGGEAITGWTIARDGNVLPSSRSGSRVFKTLSAIVTLCAESGIDSFSVRVS